MKQWLTVAEAAEAMGCKKRNAYQTLNAYGKRFGRPVLVHRKRNNRSILMVSAEDIARINGQDANTMLLLDIKETLEALADGVAEIVRLNCIQK
jgi:hypothetical protein